jgi:hypothetical protein
MKKQFCKKPRWQFGRPDEAAEMPIVPPILICLVPVGRLSTGPAERVAGANAGSAWDWLQERVAPECDIMGAMARRAMASSRCRTPRGCPADTPAADTPEKDKSVAAIAATTSGCRMPRWLCRHGSGDR